MREGVDAVLHGVGQLLLIREHEEAVALSTLVMQASQLGVGSDSPPRE